MGKFDGVLLATDFDDTLYDYSMTISEENKKAIQYFIDQGGRFTVATGRANPAFAPCFALAPINAPVILSNGSALHDYHRGETVYETFLPQRIIGDLLELTFLVPQLGLEAYHGDDIYLHNPNSVTRDHLNRVGADGVERAVRDIPQPLSKVLLEHEDRAVLERAQQYILSHWGEHYEAIFSNQVLLEVTAKGSNKGGMVLYLAQQLGIERDHIYCVGDNENDIPMLEISAIPFAPANSATAVKEWGARMVNSCDDSCIAQVIGILDELYG